MAVPQQSLVVVKDCGIVEATWTCYVVDRIGRDSDPLRDSSDLDAGMGSASVDSRLEIADRLVGRAGLNLYRTDHSVQMRCRLGCSQVIVNDAVRLNFYRCLPSLCYAGAWIFQDLPLLD